MKRALPKLLVLALVLEVLLGTLCLLGDLRQRIVETILVYILASLFYIVAGYLILKNPQSAGPALPPSPLTWLVLAAALIFRITAWPILPALSDDVFRYRWEGQLQASGGNPYQSRPNDAVWASLADEAFPRVVAKDFKAGYGPLIELQERLAYRTISRYTSDPFAQAFWFKAPAALFDLGILAALWALLRARGLPGEYLLLYAWSPLPVLEFWATGHNDSIAVFFVVLALLAAAWNRWWWAFLALSLAATAKIWPLALFPVFVGWNGRRPERWYQWTVLLPVAALFFLPYRSDITENARFLSGFVGGWRNNDTIYTLLLQLTGDVYRAKYAATALIVLATLVILLRRLPLERAVLAVLCAVLFISANSHPWYLTWILPLLAFWPAPALFAWTGLMPLAYRVLIEWVYVGEWNGSTAIRWYIYLPVYGLLLYGWVSGWVRKKLLAPES